MTGICRLPGCPCSTPLKDEEERTYVPDRPKVGRPMPPNFRERVWADLQHRREARARQDPEVTP